MKLSSTALGLTLAILWACAMGLIGLGHALFPPYGSQFFAFMASIYPGITGSGTGADIALSVAYGLIDGFIAGFVIAWLYNVLVDRLPAA